MGKRRHIQTHNLWVQDAREHKTVGFDKVGGSNNWADLFTKNLSGDTRDYLLSLVGVEFVGGQDETAYTINCVGKVGGVNIESVDVNRALPLVAKRLAAEH